MDKVIELINNGLFPIAMCLLVWYSNEKTIKNLEDTIKNLNITMEKILIKIGDDDERSLDKSDTKT